METPKPKHKTLYEGFAKLGVLFGGPHNKDCMIFVGRFWGLCLWDPPKDIPTHRHPRHSFLA